jgi:hypothetical protein
MSKQVRRRQFRDEHQYITPDERPQYNGSNIREGKLPRNTTSSTSTSKQHKQGLWPRPDRFPAGATGPKKPTHQQSSATTAGGGSLPPQVLTTILKDAYSPELLQLLQRHAASLDHIHLTAAYAKAVKLCRNGVQLKRQPAAVQQLLLQLRQLVAQLQQQCGVRALATIMWACGRLCDVDTYTMLLPVFLRPSSLQQANPQDISDVLLAAATLQLQPTGEQLQLLMQRSIEVLLHASPQAVSNKAWAFGKLQYNPQELLSALEQRPGQVQALLAAATPQDLANMAWAYGQLGCKGGQLPGVLLQQAVKLQASKGARLNLQDISNLCWGAVVLGLQQYVPQVLQLAGASGRLWSERLPEHLRQLYQVHLWLLDNQLPAPCQGLSGVMSPQQLQQCKASWEQQVAARARQQVTDLQRSVFAASTVCSNCLRGRGKSSRS